MLDLIFASLLGGLLSLGGGLLLLWKAKLAHRVIDPLIAFGAGAFLGVVFLDLLPEALEMTADSRVVLTAVLLGFGFFFILERFIMRYLTGSHHHRMHSDHTESLSFLLLLGDSLHNFLDGAVLALAYLANPALTIPAALAIAAHEVPQEIGDFSILLKLGWSRAKIITANISQSLLTIPGAILGYYLGPALQGQLPFFLGSVAGIFLYLSASDLIPELHHQSGHQGFFRVILPFFASLLLIYLLVPAH